MINTQQIAQTILEQIKGIDKFALGAWGAKNLIALDHTEKRLGGLQFDIKTPKIKKGGRVLIELDSTDTYKITVGKIVHRKTGIEWNELSYSEGIYFPSLVEAIDGVVEDKESKQQIFV